MMKKTWTFAIPIIFTVFIILSSVLSGPEDISDGNMRDGYLPYQKNYTIVDGPYSTNVLFGKFTSLKYIVPMSDRGIILGFTYIIFMLGLILLLAIHMAKKIKSNIYEVRMDKQIRREIHELVIQKRKYQKVYIKE